MLHCSRWSRAIANIQVLRAFAAILVLIFHGWPLLRPWGMDPPGWLFGWVDVFFVITGFAMVHITRRQRPGVVRFLVDRLIRIVPIYWLFTLVAYGVNQSFPGLSGWSAGPGDLVRSLLFIPYGDPPLSPPLLYVGWSLNLTVWFYALFAIGLAVTDRARHQIAVVGGLVLIPALVLLILPAPALLRFYGQPGVFGFVLGMLLARGQPRLARWPGWAGVALLAGGLVLAVLVSSGGWFTGISGRYSVPGMLLVAGALVTEARGLRLAAGPPLTLGATSYALYVTHPLILSAFGNVQDRVAPLATRTGSLIVFGAAVLVAILAAWAVHHLLERPVTRYLKQLIAVRRTVPQSVSVG